MSLPHLLDDASLPTDAAGLTAEIARIEQQQSECAARIRELMAAEDPQKGVHSAKDIHEAKQLKMMLQYQKDLRVARMRQLHG